MKIYIRANKTYTYQGYDIYQADESIDVYKAGKHVGRYDTFEEAEEAVDEILHPRNDEQPQAIIKLPRSCKYASIQRGKYDLSQVAGLDTVYVLEIDDNMYYSRDGYVAYKDPEMVVFLDKNTAINTAKRARTAYVVTPIKLTSNHTLPNSVR